MQLHCNSNRNQIEMTNNDIETLALFNFLYVCTITLHSPYSSLPYILILNLKGKRYFNFLFNF